MERARNKPLPYAIKVAIEDPSAKRFVFSAQRTMYGGRHIAPGDPIFIFDSENEGGYGLIARGVVTAARAVPRRPGVARQTPRVSVQVERSALAARPLGRRELKAFQDWHDGRPQTELNFKLYRQATNKIIGLSPVGAAFLDGFFGRRLSARPAANDTGRAGRARDRAPRAEHRRR